MGSDGPRKESEAWLKNPRLWWEDGFLRWIWVLAAWSKTGRLDREKASNGWPIHELFGTTVVGRTSMQQCLTMGAF